MKRFCSTILIVDDDENDLLFARAAFKTIGAVSTVHAVAGGRQAIAYLLGEGSFADRSVFAYPDFIITDLKMPGIDGFELLEHIRQNSASATIPTVVLSGSQDNDDIQKAYLLGANSYHIKPSNPLDLRELLKALHEYWMRCELPASTEREKILEPSHVYKLGSHILGSAAPWFMKSGSLKDPEHHVLGSR